MAKLPASATAPRSASAGKPKAAPLSAKATAKRREKTQERVLAIRDQLWPGLDESTLWKRVGNAGFITIPRTMPHIMGIIKDVSKTVGNGQAVPAERAYFALWCRRWDDEGMVIVENERELAHESGYDGERAVTTWRSHMRILKELGFVDFKAGPKSDFQYVLVLNPYKVIEGLRPRIQDKTYLAFFERALDIGAKEIKG